MARPRKYPLVTSVDDAPLPSGGDYVTYRAGEGDPALVKWGAHTFHCNVPKFIEDEAVLAKARGNRFFKVGPFTAADAVTTVEPSILPNTPEQYRAHAVSWLKRMQSVDELDTAWRKEETLRLDCEVGSDDIDFLNNLIDPLRSELRKRDLER